MNGCIDNYSHSFYWTGRNRHDLRRNGAEVFEDGTHFLDLMVRETKAFIQSHQDQPFFIYFAANSPHYPYQPDAKWLPLFSSLPYPRNLYAAFLATLDEHIGEVMQCVDDFGLRNDTIVVYQSDNGHSTEERAHFGGGSAGTFRGEKFSLFEGGIRVPAIISWPGHLPEGVTRNQMAHTCDWMPTLAELAGVDTADNIDGKSIVDVISADAPTPHEVLHWQVGTGDGARWAVRKGDWKLVFQPERGKPAEPFLVNLGEDLSEMQNVAQGSPQVAAELRALHDAWAAQI